MLLRDVHDVTDLLYNTLLPRQGNLWAHSTIDLP